MTQRNRDLLKQCIDEKWTPIVESCEALDDGPRNCVLCQEYLDCDNCPVATEAQDDGCDSTPYTDWTRHHMKRHEPNARHRVPGCAACLRLATAERDFLQMLLDKETT